jgi:hypothetical protein
VSRRDHDRGGDRGLWLGRDQCSHELDQRGGEERGEGEVVDGDGLAVVHVDVPEACLLEVVDEVTLRQGAGYSPGPGCGMREDLGRELLVSDGQVGDRELALRA